MVHASQVYEDVQAPVRIDRALHGALGLVPPALVSATSVETAASPAISRASLAVRCSHSSLMSSIATRAPAWSIASAMTRPIPMGPACARNERHLPVELSSHEHSSCHQVMRDHTHTPMGCRPGERLDPTSFRNSPSRATPRVPVAVASRA